MKVKSNIAVSPPDSLWLGPFSGSRSRAIRAGAERKYWQINDVNAPLPEVIHVSFDVSDQLGET